MTEENEKYRIIVSAIFKQGGRETPEYQKYSKRALEIIKGNGGVIIEQYPIESNQGNGKTPHAEFIADFPSKEKAMETFSGKEYQSIVPLRASGVEEISILFPKSS